jgi:hypothetical protein
MAIPACAKSWAIRASFSSGLSEVIGMAPPPGPLRWTPCMALPSTRSAISEKAWTLPFAASFMSACAATAKLGQWRKFDTVRFCVLYCPVITFLSAGLVYANQQL